MFHQHYRKKKVLVTGDTGFKGSWLCRWLQMLGAEVCGFALAPESNTPNHFRLLVMQIRHETGDIRDFDRIRTVMQTFQPDMVFHLAAQPLVRKSYGIPRETFETNFMGTVNLLEACRQTYSVQAVVVISTDKCYANYEESRAFLEEDPMGGHDPYSASKGAAELAVSAYRNSFFSAGDVRIATARAGNVIGGGDWAEDRLFPDLVRGAVNSRVVKIRFPYAYRPWQHVLEALSGYLLLGEKLCQPKGMDFAEAWNFGPIQSELVTVREAITMAQQEWTAIQTIQDPCANPMHEAVHLALDCSKAEKQLGWHPLWNTKEAVCHTIRWYRNFYENGVLFTDRDLLEYMNLHLTEEMESI